MPLYAYRCTQCGHSFEKIQSFNAKPDEKCPECGGALMRPLSAPGLSFKGAGWYVNDYSSKGSASKGSESKGSEAASSDSGAKTESSGSGSESKTACGASCASPATSTPAASSSTSS